MEKMKFWAIAAVIFYFWINALANNPHKIERFRKQMNAIVDQGVSAAKKAVS